MPDSHSQKQKRFPLLPYSQLVFDSSRLIPSLYDLPVTLVWHNGRAEKERIEHALRTAILNHPVFSMQTDRHGRHYEKPPKDILHGRYHDFRLKESGEDLILEAELNRILGDGRSCEILLEDVLRAYRGEKPEQDDYWGYLDYVEQIKQSPHYQKSRNGLIREFEDESVPVRPTTDRPLWTLLPPKAGLYKTDFTDLLENIKRLTETEHLSTDGIFSLCAALAIAEYCGTDAAALTWAYQGRERPEEERIYGSLHRDIPFLLNLKQDNIKTKEDLFRETRNRIRSGIARSDYPYTLTRPYTKRWNYAVNVLKVSDEIEMGEYLPSGLELLPFKQPKFAYALMDVERHESTGRLALWFRYSATHYKSESVARFAQLIRDKLLWLTT